jgi:dihydroorotate dehydrogenase
MYRWLYRHWLSRFDAEAAHHAAITALALIGGVPLLRGVLAARFRPATPGLAVQALGLRFDHPLGLAAGFDKDGRATQGLAALGFSFIEVGTVTPQAQPGNPRPRLFRLPEDAALINRMGFPSAGMQAVAQHLRQRPAVPIGISVGKNKDTPLSAAHGDYGAVLSTLYAHGDFFVINISSPNTPDLRKLQTPAYLADLLDQVNVMRTAAAKGTPKPLLIKIAPELTWRELDTIIEAALAHDVQGIIATNTTSARDGLRGLHRDQPGGLSGAPLHARATAIIRHVYRGAGGRLLIVGAGGIFGAGHAWEMLASGATLLQAYTGFIYEGPAFAARISAGLRQRLHERGLTTLHEVIGSQMEERRR